MISERHVAIVNNRVTILMGFGKGVIHTVYVTLQYNDCWLKHYSEAIQLEFEAVACFSSTQLWPSRVRSSRKSNYCRFDLLHFKSCQTAKLSQFGHWILHTDIIEESYEMFICIITISITVFLFLLTCYFFLSDCNWQQRKRKHYLISILNLKSNACV